MHPRIIPILLLQNSGLYKTRKFAKPIYIGDPINAVKIFNDKEVDELVLLDIQATKTAKGPDFEMLKSIASECFMPLSYGGGINDVEMVRKLLGIGIEKVIINSAAYQKPDLIPRLAARFGVSTLIGSIDVRKSWRGKEEVYIKSGSEKIPSTPENWAKSLEGMGVGEILINSIDRDGELCGYDLELIDRVSRTVSIPVIAAGGARDLQDVKAAVTESGASAAAAGSFFVFQGKHRAVLITYPGNEEVKSLWQN